VSLLISIVTLLYIQ